MPVPLPLSRRPYHRSPSPYISGSAACRTGPRCRAPAPAEFHRCTPSRSVRHCAGRPRPVQFPYLYVPQYRSKSPVPVNSIVDSPSPVPLLSWLWPLPPASRYEALQVPHGGLRTPPPERWPSPRPACGSLEMPRRHSSHSYTSQVWHRSIRSHHRWRHMPVRHRSKSQLVRYTPERA